MITLAVEGVWVALAAGLAIGIPGIMSGMGVGIAGVAAAAVASEDPKKAYKAFVFQLLPGTQGIYGFVVGFLVIIGAGLAPSNVVPEMVKAGIVGLAVLAATVPAILQGFTAYPQGLVASAGISAFAKRPEVFSVGLMYTVAVELYAILGVLATILMLTFIGIL
ncbi:MAG: V-type ATP synthase subunit K [Candidatus Hadarchaeaceae archaeon]